MKHNLENQPYITPNERQSKLYLTVTHPHHRYYGHKLEVLGRRAGPDPLIYVRLPDGAKSSLRPEWVSDATDSDQPATSANYLLAFDGLCAAARLIEQMRREGRVIKECGRVSRRRA